MSDLGVWTSRWEKSLEACARHGGTVHPLSVDRPATLPEVRRVEDELGVRLPTSLAKFFTDYSQAVSMAWFLPDELTVPGFDGIFSGGFDVSLPRLPELAADHRGWIASCFPDVDDSYDRVWHEKLAFQAVGDGDMLAINLDASDGPVVYLSHDDGDGHGYLLGANFLDFVDRWTTLGCVGAEDWQWLHFVSAPESFLEIDAPPARKWRTWFGLP